MKSKILQGSLGAALALFALPGCGSEEPLGKGTVEFTTWGEEYIEKEIPSTVFADGWSLHYKKFLVVIGAIRIADDAGAVGAEQKGTLLVDHVTPGAKKLVSFPDLDAKAWTDVSYAIRPAAGDTEVAEGATPDDLTMMRDKGYAVYVEAEASRDMVKKTFQWGFDVPTAYRDCEGDKDGKTTAGVIVTNGGIDAVELTIHGDHLYYDDLQATNAKVRFNAIAAADMDMDGVVTQDEIAAVKLVSIDPKDGAYGTGAAGNVNDLGAFVRALSRTVGHFRGEGECFGGDP